MNEIEELKAAYSNAKDNYLAAAHNEELARISACDAHASRHDGSNAHASRHDGSNAHASRHDGSNADLGVNAAYIACVSARLHMFNAAQALDNAIDYKKDK